MDKDRREGKGCRCWLGEVLEWRTSHLAEMMKLAKVFGRTSILVGWWFGMVWIGWSSIFPKHPFRKVAVVIFILFFKSSWWKISSAARNGIEQQRRPLHSLLSLSFFYVRVGWEVIVVWEECGYLDGDASLVLTLHHQAHPPPLPLLQTRPEHLL